MTGPDRARAGARRGPDPIADLSRLPGVGEAVQRSRQAVDLVLRDRGRRRLTPAATTAAAQRCAVDSAQLDDDPDRWVAGCLRAQLALPELARLVATAPGQLLARAHLLIAGGVLPPDQVGRPSAGPATTARLADLSALLRAPTDGPAAVLAAVAHAEIATLVPFGAADGAVARVVGHAVLVASGVDPDGSLTIASGHLARADEYRVALAGYAAGTTEGVRGWLLHCLDALAEGAQRSPAVWSRQG